ncbi:MAG: glycerol-3-phosphate 1-O-acyltransferase PlsY [Anaerolineae bacterium]|nr:glycerol-3-phosphate 1-O-acyltransferase PlsY [Anaerolineae bacterium]
MAEFNFEILLVVIVSYLMGSIPTAYLVGKLNNIDIFAVGSGNMGATNVSRALGVKWGVLVLAVDALKGILAIVISKILAPDLGMIAITLAAIVVIIGHNWSLFATLLTGTLRGGKGAATAFGTLLMIAPYYVIIGTVFIGGFILARTRYVSLAVLTMVAIAVIWLTILALQHTVDSMVIFYCWALSILIIVRFRENIQRLAEGKERRFGDRV